MKRLPIIHPKKGEGARFSRPIKNTALGVNRYNTDLLVENFPKYLSEDMDIKPVSSEDILSTVYNAENAYFIKVIKPSHVRLHRLMTWWRGKTFSTADIDSPFKGHSTPLTMAEYEYHTIDYAYSNGGAVPQPYALESINDDKHAAILYEYIPSNGRITTDEMTINIFEHVSETLRRLHDSGHTHSNVPDHLLRSVPDGEPFLTDIIGKTKFTLIDYLHGVGYDIGALLARFAPEIGALPALKVLGEHYSDVELIASYKTSKILKYTVPGTKYWITNQVRSSINEYANADALYMYDKITQLSDIVEKEHGTLPATNIAKITQHCIQNPNISESDLLDSIVTDTTSESPNDETDTYLGEIND